jgi:arginase family enzyme
MRRIADFGCGRMEIHSAVLKAVVHDAGQAAQLRAALTEAGDYVGKNYQPAGLQARIAAALAHLTAHKDALSDGRISALLVGGDHVGLLRAASGYH